ncbi:hypothetical protein PR202_ga14521 [Eleusine coracana subsp. coracana]|uniref:Uncharacterized protein n=1 Tax=Eleusine coracana subsp. coracana TaxID=191504 RepID=A0AAV5CHM6_ELECO|nr:hypothetical protein PR202_ga14521 [Eleusine coracana subsp. coracana]
MVHIAPSRALARLGSPPPPRPPPTHLPLPLLPPPSLASLLTDAISSSSSLSHLRHLHALIVRLPFPPSSPPFSSPA